MLLLFLSLIILFIDFFILKTNFIFFDGFVSPFYAKTPNDEFDKPFRNKILITDLKFFMWDGLFSIEITIKSSIRLKGDSICLMSIQIKSLNSFLL